MMRLKNVWRMGLMMGVMAIAQPVAAQTTPPGARDACLQRVAEAMVVPAREIEVVSAGPVDALKGTQTLSMRNTRTGQTAECEVNIIDNTVLSVNLTAQGTPPSQPSQPPRLSPQDACIQRVAEAMVVPAREIQIVQSGPVDALKGTQTLFLRNTRTGQTAECEVNTIDSTVLSVTVASQNRPPQTTPPGGIPNSTAEICTQQVAEAMVVATRDIEIIGTSPADASGVRTATLRNRTTGQTATCRFNANTGAVLSVNVNPQTQRPPAGVATSAADACIQRVAEEMVVAARDIEVTGAGPVDGSGVRTLTLRNRITGQTAQCRVNNNTGAVISVQVAAMPSQPNQPPSAGRPVQPGNPTARTCQNAIATRIRNSYSNVQGLSFAPDTTRAYFISNAEEGIRGEGQFTQGGAKVHRFRYDCTVNIRTGQVTSATHSIIR